MLIISHDRYFLDRIVTKVIEIENKKSTVYNGNYSFFWQQKEINREIQQKAYEMQQKEIKHQEDVIRTLRSFNREKSIKRAESREKALGKLERVDRPDALPNQMRLTLTPFLTSGNDVLHAEALSKSYGGQRIFRNVSFDVKRSEQGCHYRPERGWEIHAVSDASEGGADGQRSDSLRHKCIYWIL